MDKPTQELREALAALCHEQWSGWMKYLFSKCVERDRDSGGKCLVIPEWAAVRWGEQANTPYRNLSNAEQDSDRKEADRFLAVAQVWKDYRANAKTPEEQAVLDAVDRACDKAGKILWENEVQAIESAVRKWREGR